MKHPPNIISTIYLTRNQRSCNIPDNTSIIIDGNFKAKHIAKIATTKMLSTLNLLIVEIFRRLYRYTEPIIRLLFSQPLHPIQQGTKDNQYTNHFDYGIYNAFQTKSLGHIFYLYPSNKESNCGVYKCVNHIVIPQFIQKRNSIFLF